MKRVILKPVLHFKLIILFSSLILFLSCEQEEIVYNSLDIENPEYIQPETTIIFALDIVSTTSMTITFEGNQDSMEYRYHLDAQDWSDWTNSTSAVFSSLTEGEHLFRVKSRYQSGDEDPTPAEHSFTVDYTRPTTSITSPSNGATINSSTAQITWQLETGAECSYNFNYKGWTDWGSGTSATFEYLDEGSYTFSIKSRFDPLIEEESPVSINFEVDALQGPGLRILPLLSETTLEEAIEVSIYAEDIDSVVFGEIIISFDNSNLEYTGYQDGSMLSSSASDLIIFVDQNLTSSQTEIKFTFATDFTSQAGISGSGELIKLNFTATGTSATGFPIKIEDASNLRNFENDKLIWPEKWKLNGKIIIFDDK